jgi:diketogulonate reductase-like aldo/keto reductase
MEKRIELRDGGSIPQVGFGTFLLTSDQCESSVLAALEAGYR